MAQKQLATVRFLRKQVTLCYAATLTYHHCKQKRLPQSTCVLTARDCTSASSARMANTLTCLFDLTSHCMFRIVQIIKLVKLLDNAFVVQFCELAAGQWLKNEVSQGGLPKNNRSRSSPEQGSCANSVWRTHMLSAFRGEQSLQHMLKAFRGKQTELKTTNAKALKQKKC